MCLPVLAAITRVLINVTLVNPDSVCLKCIHLRKMEGTGKVYNMKLSYLCISLDS